MLWVRLVLSCPLCRVLWRGQGLPLHLVNDQWSVLGQRGLHHLQLVQAARAREGDTRFMVISDNISTSPLIDK